MATIRLYNHDYSSQTIGSDFTIGAVAGGDYNGDGFEDLGIISYHRWVDPRGGYATYQYRYIGVYLSSGDGLGPRISLPVGGENDYFGGVQFVGDVDGDGFSDLIAVEYDHFWTRAHLIFGDNDPTSTRITSLDTHENTAVGAAGDINGDGLDDFLVSNFDYGHGVKDTVYVFFGKTEGLDNLSLSEFDSSDGFRISDADNNAQFGSVVQSAGDYNGDGFDDLIISAPGSDTDGVESGRAYLIFGKETGFADIYIPDLTSEDGFVIAGQAGDRLGRLALAIGDINADGLADIAVGQKDRTIILFGQSDGAGPADLNNMSPDAGFILTGDRAANIAPLGDVDGDGIDDLMFAGSEFTAVIFGRDTGFDDLNVAELGSNEGFYLEVLQPGSTAVIAGGDFNGDGFGDIGVRRGAEFHIIYGGERFGRRDFTGTAADDQHSAGIRDDVVGGLGGNDSLAGRGGNDHLSGGDGDDRLGGGNDDDVVDGGEGTDTVSYFTAYAAVSVDLRLGEQAPGGGGVDTLLSIENVVGSAFGDTIVGTSGANTLQGGAGKDRIAGLGGGDRMDGGEGIDTADYSWANSMIRVSLLATGVQDTNVGLDRLTGFENLIGGSLHDVLEGDGNANILDGGAGNDLLISRGGADTLIGGSGMDTGSFEGNAQGVNLAIRHFDSIETLIGTDHADRLLGSNGDDVLHGGEGDDRLDGGDGTDGLYGGSGNDRYVAREGTRIHEQSDGGTDVVISFAEETLLSRHVENLTLAHGALGGRGNESDNRIVGNAEDNALSGGIGDDILDGGDGADLLRGGAGNDVYMDGGDAEIIEAAGGGTDTMRSTSNHTLAAHVERLVLVSGFEGIGNSLANVIEGNAGGNLIDGRGGADIMRGRAGDDEYRIDGESDRVQESANGGLDRVRSSISYRLTDHVEELILVGDAREAIGNGLDNKLVGNGEANRLDGGLGEDRMFGRGGDDLYIVGEGDVVVELAGEGVDRVISSVDYRLGDYVEDLALGDGALDGRGNALANALVGGSGDNGLLGEGGNDVLEGAGGDDRLAGGLGADLLSGGADYDSLSGDAGADTLLGGFGNDSLTGGTDNDRLSGGADRDRLTGGSGADGFQFDTELSPLNVDLISDFVASDDTISLDRAIFGAAGPDGRLANAAFHIGSDAADAGDRIVYNQANGTIFYDADGAGGAAAILFARIAAGTVLTAADFILYTGPETG